LGHYYGGIFECAFVSPYTKTAGNVDSDIFVLLQDWASHDSLSRNKVDEDALEYGYTRSLPTNKNLECRLKNHFGRSIRDVYATNLFPFIKPGLMDTRIPWAHLVNAARDFALPQIEIIKPKLVITLGLLCFQALKSVAKGSAGEGRLAVAIANPFELDCGAHVWCQGHTGRGAGRRGTHQTNEDWQSMAAWFNNEGGVAEPAGRR